MAGTNWQQLSGGSTNPWTIRRDDGTPTANYSDHIICDGGTVTLPAPQANEAVLVSNISAITEIVPNGTETIEGKTSVLYNQNNPIAFVSNGVDWYVSNNLNYVGTAPDGLVDSFEDQDLEEYTADPEFSVSSDRATDGDYALKYDGSAGFPSIVSTSGLNAYPEAGDVYKYDLYLNSGAGSNLYFGVQDGDNLYGAYVNLGAGFTRIEKRSSGTDSSLEETSNTPPTSEWVSVEIDWGIDGTIGLDVFDASDNNVVSISASDSDYTSGGIGAEGANAVWYADHLRIE